MVPDFRGLRIQRYEIKVRNNEKNKVNIKLTKAYACQNSRGIVILKILHTFRGKKYWKIIENLRIFQIKNGS